VELADYERSVRVSLPENGVYRGQDDDDAQRSDRETGSEVESLTADVVSPAAAGAAQAVGAQHHPDESEQDAEHVDGVEMVAGPAFTEENSRHDADRRQYQEYPRGSDHGTASRDFRGVVLHGFAAVQQRDRYGDDDQYDEGIAHAQDETHVRICEFERDADRDREYRGP